MAFRRGFIPGLVVIRICALCFVVGTLRLAAPAADLLIRADFPGGNILVEQIEGDSVWLRQDRRTNNSPWFYWQFAVSGAQGRTLEFHFTGGDVIGLRGPAMSCDAGQTWTWLGTNVGKGQSFRYTFGPQDEETRFAAIIPYAQPDWDRFVEHYATNSAVKVGSLGLSPKGRTVEWLRAGRVDGQAPYRILITCRHHAVEAAANFVAEGLIQEVIDPDGAGPWFSENAEVCLAPFIDADGVEDGEQGQFGQLKDPWLDYGDESHYSAVLALRARFDPPLGLPVHLAFDLHCPGLRDDRISLSASPATPIATNTARFSRLLQQQPQTALAYRHSDYQPGHGENQTNQTEARHDFMAWADTLSGMQVVATIDLPYASVGSAEVTPDTARAFGKTLATTIRAYLTAGKEPALQSSSRSARRSNKPSVFENARKSRTNTLPALMPPAPTPTRRTNSWNRVLGDHQLAGTPWPRHTIDNSSVGADGVKLADVDGDGRLDIITGWEEGGEIRLYFHPGPALCREPWPQAVVGSVRSPEDAVLADLDGDGHPDALSATEANERTLYLHWASPELNSRQDSGWETRPIPDTRGKQMWMSLLPLQVDGQHGFDVITGSKGDHGAIGWLQAPADARDLNAWRWFSLRPAAWIMSLRAIDLDGDGDRDILFSDRRGATAGVSWLENPGPAAAARHAGWPEHLLAARGMEVMFLDAGDLAGDGSLTIAAAVKPAEILLLRRAGPASGTNDWIEEWIHLEINCGHAKAVKMADFDRDGRKDLVFSCEGAIGPRRGVIWLRREETGWRPQDLSGPAGAKFDLIETIDIDGDGDLDVLTCEETENLGVVWYENPL